MTVKAWFTISALILVALFASVAYRFLRPLDPPAIVASVPTARLEGSFRSACWPTRSGPLRCTSEKSPPPIGGPVVPGDDTMRLVAAFPTPPQDGKILIVNDSSRTVQAVDRWTDKLQYDLSAGRYRVLAEARYAGGAFVRYAFGFTVR